MWLKALVCLNWISFRPRFICWSCMLLQLLALLGVRILQQIPVPSLTWSKILRFLREGGLATGNWLTSLTQLASWLPATCHSLTSKLPHSRKDYYHTQHQPNGSMATFWWGERSALQSVWTHDYINLRQLEAQRFWIRCLKYSNWTAKMISYE